MEKAEKALRFLMSLSEIDETKYSQMLQEKIGVQLLSLFENYCKELVPPDQQDMIVNTLVHLMITGYLIRTNEDESLTGPSIELA